MLVCRRFGEPLRLDFQSEMTEQQSDVYFFVAAGYGYMKNFVF